jgi:hypothetical protein
VALNVSLYFPFSVVSVFSSKGFSDSVVVVLAQAKKEKRSSYVKYLG